MVSTGYHTEDVWFSMIFQMLVGLSVLQDKNIHFHNFSLEDNIFVKDIYCAGCGRKIPRISV